MSENTVPPVGSLVTIVGSPFGDPGTRYFYEVVDVCGDIITLEYAAEPWGGTFEPTNSTFTITTSYELKVVTNEDLMLLTADLIDNVGSLARKFGLS